MPFKIFLETPNEVIKTTTTTTTTSIILTLNVLIQL